MCMTRVSFPVVRLSKTCKRKVEQITAQIEALQILRTELQGVLSGWQDQPSPEIAAQTICPNLAMTNESKPPELAGLI